MTATEIQMEWALAAAKAEEYNRLMEPARQHVMTLLSLQIRSYLLVDGQLVCQETEGEKQAIDLLKRHDAMVRRSLGLD